MTWVVGGALTVTTLAVTVAYWVASTHKEKPAILPQSVPIDVHQQVSGYTFTRSDEGRRVFTVHAARTMSFKQGGSTVLDDVVVELFGRTGNRRDVMRTQRCNYNSQNGDLFSSGPVQIELNAQPEKVPVADLKGRQTVYLETSKVSYRHEGSLVMSDQEVRFRMGPTSGTAQGMAYATRDGWLELEKDVVMELHPRDGAASESPLRLIASRLRYNKLSRQIVLWGPVQAVQGVRTVSAGSGNVFLNEANRVTHVALEGSVKASEASAERLVELSADRAQGDIDPESGALSHLSADGNVAGQSRGRGSRVDWWRKKSNSVLPVFPPNLKWGMLRETYDSWLNLHLP